MGFRGYAQRDPLNEYKNEAFQLFESMLDGLRVDVTQTLGQIRPRTEEEQQELLRQFAQQQAKSQAAAEAAATKAPAGAARDGAEAAGPVVAASEPLVDGFDETNPDTWGNPGRNDPCPCGSGNKFKHCHGRLA